MQRTLIQIHLPVQLCIDIKRFALLSDCSKIWFMLGGRETCNFLCTPIPHPPTYPPPDCLPIIAPWPPLPSYDFPPERLGECLSTFAQNQNGQLHFIRIPTIAPSALFLWPLSPSLQIISTDCSWLDLSLWVFLHWIQTSFHSFPSIYQLSQPGEPPL